MKKENARGTVRMDMLHGGLLGKMLMFALPLAASSILQQLFNSVDVAVVGRFASSQALAAVGSNGSLISLLINLFVGVSVGANVVIGNYIGQKDDAGVYRSVQTVGVIAIVSGLLLMVVGLVAARPILELMDTPHDVIDLASLYLRIYFLGMPFIMIFNFGAAVLRSMGDTKRPLYSLVVAGIINTVLNLILVIVFHMSVAGVAIATTVSNAVNAAIIVYILKHESYPFRIHVKEFKIAKPELRKMLRIGVPAGLQGMVFSFANVFIQSAINGFGSAAVAGSAVELNYEYYCYFVVSAFVQATVTFTSQNYGAGEIDRCRRIFRIGMVLSVVCCGALNIFITWQNPFFISLFTDNLEVAGYAAVRMFYVLCFQFIASSYEISGAAMRGLGHSMTPTVLTVFGTCVLRLVWVYTVARQYPTYEVLMAVYPISWIVTGTAVWFTYYRVRKKAFALRTI